MLISCLNELIRHGILFVTALFDAIELVVLHVLIFLPFITLCVHTLGFIAKGCILSQYPALRKRMNSFAILSIAKDTEILGKDQNSCETSCADARYSRRK